MTYMSRAEYDRDQELLKAAKMGEEQIGGESIEFSGVGDADRLPGIDRLSHLPTETQVEIVKYLIPNRGRIAIGYDYDGPNTSGIRSGSLNILRVSKHLSEIALSVLYGYRWFRISARCAYRSDNPMPTVSVSQGDLPPIN